MIFCVDRCSYLPISLKCIRLFTLKQVTFLSFVSYVIKLQKTDL